MESHRAWCPALIAAALLTATAATAAIAPVQLSVDATDAPRGMLRVQLHLPARPGPLTLFYPKWIPGEHMPGGPINNLTGLHFTANGAPVKWQRDAENLFAFHLEVPAGADAVEVAFDYLQTAGGSYSAGTSSTAKLLDLNWNQLLLYPATEKPLELSYEATLKLPAGWNFGTALPLAATTRNPRGEIAFLPAPLETLIDSPVIAGEFFRSVELTPGETPPHFLDLVADSAAALELKPEDQAKFARLVREANAHFGAHHYRDYHFLLTLSDHVVHFGLEHHESSDNRTDENFLTDADALLAHAELLPHEMVHSWNGKFRRPAGLAQPDYQRTMEDELLWVYEGLTDYLGKVLATRSGLEAATNMMNNLALTAATLDHRSGRSWRSLADTSISAPLVYKAPGAGANRRRTVDFYSEGGMVWLEVDTIIRQQTHGKKSLVDFCHAFHGGASSGPRVAPYTLADIEKTLNSIAPYAWPEFFQQRVYSLATHPPLGGLENAGWRLAYTNEPPPLQKPGNDADLTFSLGVPIGGDGNLGEVLPDSPAERAGLNSSMKLVAVNGRSFSAKILRAAVKAAATNAAPVELLVVQDEYYKTCQVNYHGGLKYPVLERIAGKPDLLADILKPLTPDPGTNAPAPASNHVIPR